MIRTELEALLRRDDWMRRVARALVSNVHDAEDAVQDAWAADLIRGHEARERRPWLRGVLRKSASQRRQRERVLRDRSLAAARDCGPRREPPTDESVAAAELQRIVAERVLELDEPWRRTAQLAYFAGLSTREVAKRTGVSQAAVRKRLAKALALLRADLDAKNGGDRELWTLGLVPFLAVPSAVEGTSLAEAPIPPRTVKPLACLAGTAVLAVTATTLALWSGPSRADGPSAPAERNSIGSAPASASVVRESAVRAPAALPPPATAAQSNDEAVVRVRVLKPDGSPAVGARWALSGTQGHGGRAAQFGLPPDWEDISGTADAEGQVEVRFEAPPAYDFEFWLEVEGAAAEGWRWSDLWPGTTKDLGTVQLRPEALLVGQILDTHGDPYHGGRWSIRVRETAERYVTARATLQRWDQGDVGIATYCVRGLGPGTYTVDPNFDFGPTPDNTFEVVLGAESATEHDIVVPPSDPTPAAGLTLVLQREPVAGHVDFEPSAITVRASDGSLRDVVGEGSRFRVPSPGPGPLEISVDDPRFEPWSESGVDPNSRVRARLRGSSGLRVRARTPSGESVPVDRVHVGDVRIVGGTVSRTFGEQAHVLEAGVLDGLVAGSTYELTVETPEARGTAWVEAATPGAVNDAEIDLVPRFVVRGRVTFEDGSPAAFANVHLVVPAAIDDSENAHVVGMRVHGDVQRSRRAVAEAWTERDGRYALDVPGPGDYFVYVATHGGVETHTSRLTLEGGDSVQDLTLPRPGSIRGRIELPAYAESRDWFVHVEFPGRRRQLGFARDECELDSTGAFTLEGLPPGPVRLSLDRDGSGTGLYGGPPMPGATLFAEVDVESDVVHTLSLPATAAYPGAVTVEFSGLESAPGPRRVQPVANDRLQLWSTNWGASSATDRAGPMELGAGPWTLEVTGPDWALDGVPVDVALGTSVTVPVHASLEWREVVVTRGGEPCAHAALHIRAGAEGGVVRVETDVNGRVRVGLPTGSVEFAPAEQARRPSSYLWERMERTAVGWPVQNGATIELD